MRITRAIVLWAAVLLLAGSWTAGQAAPPVKPKGKGIAMDYGPVFCYSLLPPGGKGDDVLVVKGVNVRLADGKAGVSFDTDTLRYVAGWTGGFVDVSKSNLNNPKGTNPAMMEGKLAFTTKAGPGWAKGGVLTDPRARKDVPLPREWGHWRGYYLHGQEAVLSYTVGEAQVLEVPGIFTVGVGPDANQKAGPLWGSGVLPLELDQPADSSIDWAAARLPDHF